MNGNECTMYVDVLKELSSTVVLYSSLRLQTSEYVKLLFTAYFYGVPKQASYKMCEQFNSVVYYYCTDSKPRG
jgi:hypothetical protein